jgi:2-amino-4-hydroxy-6-hydroxymethyldihydropteridine diphosphokinase/dihydropteroate synthase
MSGRLAPIEQACTQIDSLPSTKIRRTSGLWNTKAMYVIDQEDFLNGVAEITTDLQPLELLDALQGIENGLGRVKVIDKGPRNIDLDILLYDNIIFQHERLLIPHKLMLERDFVLRPLCQLIPHSNHPSGSSFSSALTHLDTSSPSSKALATPLTFLSPTHAPLTPLLPDRRTDIMSILNFTPDSFSDGGTHSPSDPSSSFSPALLAASDIIDIGGQSTRPGAPLISPAEEAARILPAITHAASLSGGPVISVDTFRASVAEEALKAGAHCINDISAGRLDPAILPVVAKYGASIILTHSRGVPQDMLSPEHTRYAPDLISAVAVELVAAVAAAEAAGVRRWKILLDPGFGFAKTFEQNVMLLRGLKQLREVPELQGLPWVIGTSRKRMVRKLSEPERLVDVSDVAVAMAAVEGGADVLRVHDPAMGRVVGRVGDSVWRVDGKDG